MVSGIDLVIFDCDGVLVDSEKSSIRIDQDVLADLGWHLTPEEILHRFVGRSSAHFRTEVEAHLNVALPDDWEEPYLPRYAAAFDEDLEAVADLPGLLGIP